MAKSGGENHATQVFKLDLTHSQILKKGKEKSAGCTVYRQVVSHG